MGESWLYHRPLCQKKHEYTVACNAVIIRIYRLLYEQSSLALILGSSMVNVSEGSGTSSNLTHRLLCSIFNFSGKCVPNFCFFTNRHRDKRRLSHNHELVSRKHTPVQLCRHLTSECAEVHLSPNNLSDWHNSWQENRSRKFSSTDAFEWMPRAWWHII